MFLEPIFPVLPITGYAWFVHIAAIAGSICLAYAVFIEKEYRQDIIRGLGSLGLMVYAIFIENKIFAYGMGLVALASFVEFGEIMLGMHTHDKENLKKYKKLWRTRKK